MNYADRQRLRALVSQKRRELLKLRPLEQDCDQPSLGAYRKGCMCPACRTIHLAKMQSERKRAWTQRQRVSV